jgi:hypothetical protein
VRDAGSKNGTWIDGARLGPPPAQAIVRPGEHVAFGTVMARYLDLAKMRVFLGAHPLRVVGRKKKEQPVSPESGRHVFAAAVDVLDRLHVAGAGTTNVDVLRPDVKTEDDE